MVLRVGAVTAAAVLLATGIVHTPASAAGAQQPASGVVHTAAGPVRGVAKQDRWEFRGIPYAAPPTGERRWKAPQAPSPWRLPLDTTGPGKTCPQLPSSYSQVSSTDEDCLVLNVTAPRHEPVSGGLPVMVWIHGDGAVGAGHFFDATRLSLDGDVVVVTINYRLGVFGGFGLPGLAGSGTFGLQDQQAALRWVRRNISGFGGDPNNVTIFGVSYGATAVTAHLVAPGSAGLFDRAVIQSGFGLVPLPAETMYPGGQAQPWMGWRPESEVEDIGAWVAGELSCGTGVQASPRSGAEGDPAGTLECLRGLPVEKILGFEQVMNIFQPVAYGGATLPELAVPALRAGRFHQVPVLSGATKDEHRTFVGLFRVLPGLPVTEQEYPNLLAAAFGQDRAEQLHREYPLSPTESPSLTWARVLTDGLWARATFEQNRLLSARTPVYAYEFADRAAPVYLPFPEDFPAGAHHASDTPYVFRDEQFVGEASPAQLQLSDRIIQYWSSFARTGDPNGSGQEQWKPFHPQDAVPYVQSLAPEAIGPVDYGQEHRLSLWDSLLS